jgi:DNA-binding NarL/FixJ family response regulator
MGSCDVVRTVKPETLMPGQDTSEAVKPDSQPVDERVIRVAVVEDDAFIRQRVSEDIVGMPDFSLVCSCRSAEEALEKLPATQPDVVLMDIGLPGMKGTECVRQLKALLPGVQVLMVTVYEDSQQIFDALLAGASGYLLKRMSRAELFDAIRQVHQGGSPLSGHIARKVVQHFNRLGEQEKEMERLSKREREVLEYLAQGLAYKEIAETLHLSIETIRMNEKHIYAKLHVHSRGEAVAKYIRK